MPEFRLYKPEELRPIHPALRAHLAEEFPGLGAAHNVLRCTTDEAKSRVWDIAAFVRPHTVPDTRWVATQETLLAPEDLPSGEFRGWISRLEHDCGREMILGLDRPDATLVAPWSTFLDHLSPGVAAWVLAPSDAEWFVYNHHGEFLEFIRMDYGRIAQLGFARRFQVPRGGPIVEKPRYLIRYTEGDPWVSGKLSVEEHSECKSLFAFLSAKSGKAVEQLDVLPDDLTRRRA